MESPEKGKKRKKIYFGSEMTAILEVAAGLGVLCSSLAYMLRSVDNSVNTVRSPPCGLLC
jgi:hypothetical protein